MASQKPFVLVDNFFDRINLYPLATLSSTAAIAGREVQYLADYRRERTFFQAATAVAGHAVSVDLSAGVTAQPDTVWIDRGHNLWGQSISIIGSDDNFGTQPVNVTPSAIPAIGTVGGDPTTGWCVTEEGALYTIIAPATARRYWRLLFNTTPAAAIVLTGLVLGKRTQLLGYSSVVDEDAGDRNVRSESSLIPGYFGDDRSYSARMLELKLSQIGATEYDSSIRNLRRLLFDVNQPAVVCMNYGTYPERTWLYKYQGNRWNSPLSRVHRSASIPLYEHGPLIR
jgi:hypothetical protein